MDAASLRATSRGPDRRQRRVSFRYPDRRYGFDRRRPPVGTRRRACQDVLEAYGSSARTVAAVLLVVVLLNIVDLLLTVRALDGGAGELNPLLDYGLARHPGPAAAIKVVIGAGVALVIWLLRRYRRVLELSLLLLVGFAALLGYHFAGVLVLAS